MAHNDHPGTDLLLKLWSKWNSAMPRSLRRVKPEILIRLLTFEIPEEGISLTDLRRELGLNQPHISKLTKKLVKVGWVRVKASASDGRVVLLTMTVLGREVLTKVEESLKTSLRMVFSSKPAKSAGGTRRRKPRPAPGQQAFDIPQPDSP